MYPFRTNKPKLFISSFPLFKGLLGTIHYKTHVYLSNLSFGKIFNVIKLLISYFLNKTEIDGYPAVIKIDLTPRCQLQCDVCIHAESFSPKQHFKSDMNMPIDLFKKICDEVSGHTLAFSLHFYGEPLLNTNIPRMITYAAQKRINTYFTTNFSMQLTDQEFTGLIESGLHTIIISLDGFSQETYNVTRKNGNVDLVKDNVTRLCLMRKKLKKDSPLIVIQSLIFDHNQHEKKHIEKFCKEIGVDSVYFPKGHKDPWKKGCAPRTTPKAKKVLPLCPWPFFFAVVIYDGDIIPCCFYRQESIYAENISRIKMGNANDQSIKEIFNHERYQLVRKLCTQPIAHSQGNKIFCYLCQQLYD